MDYYQILKNYNDVLEPADIQEILMIGRNTAYHYLSKGLIKSIKIAGKYRIPKLYLLEFIYPDMNFTNFRNVYIYILIFISYFIDRILQFIID